MYFLELWYGSVALHGEGLPGAGLSVGEDCPVVTLGLLLLTNSFDKSIQCLWVLKIYLYDSQYLFRTYSHAISLYYILRFEIFKITFMKAPKISQTLRILRPRILNQHLRPNKRNIRPEQEDKGGNS